MANETQTAASAPDDFERQLYDYLTRQKGEGAPLPDPAPGNQWLEREAAGDPELQGLFEKEEALENSYIGYPANKYHEPDYIRKRDNLLSEIAIKNMAKRVRERP
jgi:hypothetical protein